MITEIIIDASIKASKAVVLKAVPFARLSKQEQRELKIVKLESQILAFCQ